MKSILTVLKAVVDKINMWNRTTCSFVLFLIVCMSSTELMAQLPTADLSRMKPRVARSGESVTVTLYGTNLENLSELRFTHPGITATLDTSAVTEFFPASKLHNKTFVVTVSADVPPGIYEARSVGYFGLSTARPFVIAASDSVEVAETGDHSTFEKAMPIELNTVLTGTVPSRGIDWYRIQAKAGQRILIEALAERIDSRLDGMFVLYDSAGREIARDRQRYGRDPFLELNAKQDGEYFLAISDVLYRGGPDYYYRLSLSTRPHIDFILPPAGQPGSQKRYTIYGRNLPGGSLGEAVEIDGQLLESVEVEIELPAKATTPATFHSGVPREGMLPGYDFSLEGSNSFRIGYATAAVIAKDETSPIQNVTVPVEIAGRFLDVGQEDVYQFQAVKGKSYSVEVIADRMLIPIDSFLVVHLVEQDENGKEKLTQVAENDDISSFFSVNNNDAVDFNTNDSALTFQAEQDGLYRVTVIDQHATARPNHLYRLAIREPQHDFQLMASAERPLATGRTGYSVTPLLRSGAGWGIRVIAPRQDGFEGDIVVKAQGLPAGVHSVPLVLSGKTDRGFLVISADEKVESWAGEIQIVGEAKINNQKVVRNARFASLIWGMIFSDAIRVRSRLTTRIPLAVNAQEKAPVLMKIEGEQREWTVEIGEKVEIPIKVIDHGVRNGNLTVEPFGIFGLNRSAPTVNIAEKESQGKLVINFTPNGNFKLEPGKYQFVLRGTGVVRYQHNLPASIQAKADLNRIEQMVGMLNNEKTRLDTELKKSKENLDQAQQQLKLAAAETKVELEAKKNQAQKEFETVTAALKTVTTKQAEAEKAKAEADKLVKSTESKAAEKNEKFAAWSEPVTVIVNEKAKK